MARAIDLTSKEWCDLIFENRNQLYGACEIRRTSTRRHLISLGIVIVFGFAFALTPKFIAKFFPPKPIEKTITLGSISIFDPYEEEQKKVLDAVKEIVVPQPALKATVKFTAPIITEDNKVTEEDEILSQAALSDIKAGISVRTEEGVEGGTEDIADFIGKTIGDPTEGETPVDFVEQMPQFVGGDKEMMSYLTKNIKYPVIAQEQNIQGTVVVRFVVGKDGNIKDAVILRSLDPSCDKEALRVVKSMPKWIPGRQNGNPVAVYYTLPVRFKLSLN